jgi:AraC family transcriptional activator of tynA and feaB
LSKGEDDDLFFCQQLQGKLEIQQAGREATLSKGDMVLLDPVLPYLGAFSSGSKLLVLKLQRKELHARIGETSIFVGLPLISQDIEKNLTSEFISALPQWAGRVCSSTSEIMQTYCVDLIATSIGKLTGKKGTHISSTRASALMAVRMAIEVRLQDPTLSPAKIAAAAGITARYANLLLACEGTSLSRLLLSRRLDRCRKTLGDSSQRHRTISDIAYGWGFSDMTHFSRTFKTAFGMLPSGYRRMAAESTSAEL